MVTPSTADEGSNKVKVAKSSLGLVLQLISKSCGLVGSFDSFEAGSVAE